MAESATTTTETASATTTVVVTKLTARGLRGVRGVVRQTGAVVADCQSVAGFLGGRLAVDPRGLLWTLTVWESPAALRTFAALHAPVAAGIDVVASNSDITAFRHPGSDVPTWAAAAQRTTLGRPRLALQRAIAPASA